MDKKIIIALVALGCIVLYFNLKLVAFVVAIGLVYYLYTKFLKTS